MGVGADDDGDAAVEMVGERLLLARRLGVDVDEDGVGDLAERRRPRARGRRPRRGRRARPCTDRPMRLTTRTRAPFRVSTMAAPRPGVPGGKFAGRTSRGWRSMKTSASRWSQEWLPSVTASAPAIRISSQIASVMPKPPAAFSPLMTTQSSRQRSRSAGSALGDGVAARAVRRYRRGRGGASRISLHLRLERPHAEVPARSVGLEARSGGIVRPSRLSPSGLAPQDEGLRGSALRTSLPQDEGRGERSLPLP